jgi:hypothetical protein
VIGAENLLAVGQGAFVQWDRLGVTARAVVRLSKVIPGDQGVGVVGAEDPSREPVRSARNASASSQVNTSPAAIDMSSPDIRRFALGLAWSLRDTACVANVCGFIACRLRLHMPSER